MTDAHSAIVHSDPSAHAPQPSFWPIILAAGMGAVAVATLMVEAGKPLAVALLAAGVLVALFGAMGWANTIAVERRHMDFTQTSNDLTRGFFMFLVSEAMIFVSFFIYIYYSRLHMTDWPPSGMPRLETELPAIATLLLVFSSFTLNWSVHAFLHGRRTAAKNWMLLTIALGIAFLSMQGYDWGYLQGVMSFTPSAGMFPSAYFIMTGFHGAHVTVGLLMLSLVYWRMEKGEYDEKWHISMKCGEYYWHFVDIVWVFLFATLYLF